ncbi:MAG: hypothetical protein HYX68_29625 [Planctomycetes bacterium]|nr:hypothetical protein [Planctomycetota bacterium]
MIIVFSIAVPPHLLIAAKPVNSTRGRLTIAASFSPGALPDAIGFAIRGLRLFEAFQFGTPLAADELLCDLMATFQHERIEDESANCPGLLLFARHAADIFDVGFR